MTKRDEWSKRIAEQRESGESIAAYCRRVGISKPSFEYWRTKLKSDEGRFVSVSPVKPSEVTIELTNGAVIRVSDIGLLSQIIEVLNARA
jgi:hypothetical protein